MSADHILSIDYGTQSVRALLFDARGVPVASCQVPIEPYASPHPGWAEQDPDYYWNRLCEACAGLWPTSPVGRDAVAAVALTTQRATIIAVDHTGAPLRPAIVWLDQRQTQRTNPLSPWWQLALRVVGMDDAAKYFIAQAESNWIRTHQPDIWRRTHKLLFLSGFLTQRLVNRWVDSVASQVGYIPFDYRRLRWAGARDWKWAATGLTPEMLPELVAPGEPLGEITPQAAAATGLPAGVPLIAAGADKACEALGAGCLTPSVGCLSYGTTATINTIHQRYVESTPWIPPYPAAIPDHYALEIQIYRGYWMVSWFKQQFGHREQRLAAERGIAPEQLFDELVAEVPPGSMGLVLQPYWSPGVKIPGPEAKGAVIGFGDVHTRAHLYRAILEGLAYALREGMERCERRSGIRVDELRVAGGGSQSNVAMQLTADIFGLPAARPHLYEACALGAAIDGAVGVTLHPDFPTAVGEMTRIGQLFEPNDAVRSIYEGLYTRVYRRMYRRLQPLYEEIREITGYPE